MSYMNESAWPGPDTAGNEAEDSGVIQATPENEAADTSGVQGTSEELRPAEESVRCRAGADGRGGAGSRYHGAVWDKAGTEARRKEKQEEPAEGDAVLGESGGETSPEGTGEAEDAAEGWIVKPRNSPTVSRKNPASPGRRLTAQRLSKTPARAGWHGGWRPQKGGQAGSPDAEEKSSRAKAEVKGTAQTDRLKDKPWRVGPPSPT
ncbi:MAG: hypothetical protein ACLRIS_18170 [Flavonifractor plautii]